MAARKLTATDGGLFVFEDTSKRKLSLLCPTGLAGDYSLELPDADGSAGQFLKTSGAAKLSFGTAFTGSPTAGRIPAIGAGSTLVDTLLQLSGSLIGLGKVPTVAFDVLDNVNVDGFFTLGTDVRLRRSAADELTIDDDAIFAENLDVTKILRTIRGPELTISGGTITPTASFHPVDTEADAATDNLDNITSASAGDILILHGQDGGRVTTVRSFPTGNIFLSQGETYELTPSGALVLLYTGVTWVELARTHAHGFDGTGDLDAPGGYRSYFDGWYVNGVGAGVPATTMERHASTEGTVPGIVKFIKLPRAGSITGLQAWLNNTLSAGSITVEVYINSVATGLSVTLNSGSNNEKVTQAKDLDSFFSGETIELRYSSDGSVSPTTRTLHAILEVET